VPFTLENKGQKTN